MQEQQSRGKVSTYDTLAQDEIFNQKVSESQPLHRKKPNIYCQTSATFRLLTAPNVCVMIYFEENSFSFLFLRKLTMTEL